MRQFRQTILKPLFAEETVVKNPEHKGSKY